MKKHLSILKKSIAKLTIIFFISTFLISLLSCSKNKSEQINISTKATKITQETQRILEDGTYTSKDDVALYIYTYKKLPKNFITKKEAESLGWNNAKNYVGDVAKGKSIGGDIFKNYEKLLPIIRGRTYYECDIDYKGKKRNAKRIIYADDFDENIGFIYYTEDHYKTFERLY